MRLSTTLALLLMLLISFSCQQENTRQDHSQKQTAPFSLEVNDDAELIHGNLRLLPVTATAEFIEQNEPLANYQSLGEAMNKERFRITEKKPYGRFTDEEAVNALTVQNKSEEAVFLMAGEVVQGGNQDRVIAQDMLIPPATITDIRVFCVEKGRWTPRAEEVEESNSKNNRPIAFSGYYNVASNDIRRTVKHSKNQQEVWDKVGKVTSVHNATATTGTYAALENSDSYTALRNEYLRFFKDKLDQREKVVGMVAVSGNEIIGADVFGHPELFKKQYEALLHSYITEAITSGAEPAIAAAQLNRYGDALAAKYESAKDDEECRYELNGRMIHFTNL